ncbi:MAG TPA: hypothetical protein VI685_11870, partial [Candidatus Angelobacter sp.]
VCFAAISYAQIGGSTSSSPPPTAGAYDPHPLPAGIEAPPPIDQSPKDAFMRDSKLAAKLQKLLPTNGPNINEACDGFKKLGDCVSAIHASNNLAIPFVDLKAKVTGKGAESLEKAIRELKPDVDAKAEKKKAYKQAERDIPVSN